MDALRSSSGWVTAMTDIALPVPYLEAFNANGSSAGVVPMTGTDRVSQTLPVIGTAITRIVITASQDETRLLSVCFTAR